MPTTLTLWLIAFAFATVSSAFTWGVHFAILFPAEFSSKFTGLFSTWGIAWLHTADEIVWFLLFFSSVIGVLAKDCCEETLDRYRKWSFFKLSFFGFFVSSIMFIMSWGIWGYYGETVDRRFDLLTLTAIPNALANGSTLPQTISYVNSLRAALITALNAAIKYLEFNIIYLVHHGMSLVLTTFIVLKGIHYFFIHWVFKDQSKEKRSKKLVISNKVSTDSSTQTLLG